MSLQISIRAEEQPNSFYVFDCTGEWSAENPGGWGGPNPRIEDIRTSELIISPPAQSLPVTLTPGQLDTIKIAPIPPPVYKLGVYPSFPNAQDPHLGYEVLPYMVGNNNNVIISGKWRIMLTVTGVYGPKQLAFSNSGFVDVVFNNQITCCIDKMQKLINAGNYKDPKSKLINELNNLLFSANKAIGCGLLDQADGIIGLLETQCACLDC